MVVCHVNLWCNHTILLLCLKTLYAMSATFPITEPYEWEMSKFKLWPDIWYCACVAWFISGAWALIPRLHVHDNLGDSWQSCAIRIMERKHGCAYVTSQWTFYKEVTLFRQWNGQALAAKQSAIPTSEEWSEISLCVYDTYIYLLLYI